MQPPRLLGGAGAVFAVADRFVHAPPRAAVELAGERAADGRDRVDRGRARPAPSPPRRGRGSRGRAAAPRSPRAPRAPRPVPRASSASAATTARRAGKGAPARQALRMSGNARSSPVFPSPSMARLAITSWNDGRPTQRRQELDAPAASACARAPARTRPRRRRSGSPARSQPASARAAPRRRRTNSPSAGGDRAPHARLGRAHRRDQRLARLVAARAAERARGRAAHAPERVVRQRGDERADVGRIGRAPPSARAASTRSTPSSAAASWRRQSARALVELDRLEQHVARIEDHLRRPRRQRELEVVGRLADGDPLVARLAVDLEPDASPQTRTAAPPA